MEKQEMIKMVNAIKDPSKEKQTIYKLGKELGLKLEPTKCGRCLRDYVEIIKEELGLIDNAADSSDFNGEYDYVYVRGKAVWWNGHILDNNTPINIKEEFYKKVPEGFYKRVPKKTDTKSVVENNINNEA